MRYQDLPKEIQDLVLQRKDEQKIKSTIDEILDRGVIAAFDWSDSPEGHNFWSKIHQGDIEHFYTVHPKPLGLIKAEYQSLYKKTFRRNKIVESEIDLKKIKELGLEHILNN